MNTARALFFISLFLLANNNLKACKCGIMHRDTLVTKRLKIHDIVFLGELIGSDSQKFNYSFKILETFKGNFKNKTIKSRLINSCSLFPKDKGLWIIYGNYQNDSLIEINECGPSMSLINPGILIPPPPFIKNNKEIYDFDRQIKNLENKIEGLSNWEYELYKLRLWKQTNYNEIPNKNLDYHLIFLLVSLILNVFMFIALIRKTAGNKLRKQSSDK
jgi:hypothetical protein